MRLALFAISSAFIVGYLVYPPFINFLTKTTAQQKVSEYALEEFKNKKKTVTFGGVVFVLVPAVISLIMNIMNLNAQLITLVVVYVGYGFLGFVDDYKIIKEGKNDGLSAKTKLAGQFALAIFFYFAYISNGGDTMITIPLINFRLDLGWFYFPIVAFMLAGFSNAVNLTDGMDGLATGTVLLALLPFAYFAFQGKQTDILNVIMAVMGALLAFLFYNYAPAKIYMGDAGSLPLGALLAMLAIILDMDVYLIVIGGVFVYETLTVIIQQISVRTRKKRVFKYTPIHYSFTLSGWKEIDVVHFFWALGLCCAIIGFVLRILS